MTDDFYFQRACRPGIRYGAPKVLANDTVGDVQVITKLYDNYESRQEQSGTRAGAHIETFVISKDERVKSRHIIHPPRERRAALRMHKALVNGVRQRLGLAVEEPAKVEAPRHPWRPS